MKKVIVDANAAHQLVANTETAKPIIEGMLNGHCSMVQGGLLDSELEKVGGFLAFVLPFVQAGRVLVFSDIDVRDETLAVEGLGLCCSNDCHVIGLARVSGARVLFSFDRDLHKDFRNKSLVDNPRGQIYKDPGHRHLLK